MPDPQIRISKIRKELKEFAHRRKEGGSAQKNYIRKREGAGKVANGLRFRAVSDLRGTYDSEDTDFYGICNDF